jgi:hypothetical protein
MNLISTYFLGYALCILGFIFLLMSILVIRQHFHRVKLQAPKTNGTDQQPDDSNPFRAVINQDQKSGKASSGTSDESKS